LDDSLNNLLIYDEFAEKYIEEIKNKEYSLEFAKNLIFLFKHKNQIIRQLVIETAIFLMKKYIVSKKDLIPVIWMGLGDKNCVYEALSYFLEFKDENGIEIALSIFLTDKNGLNRTQACEVMIKLTTAENSNKIIPFLEDGLNDNYYSVRSYCASGLALYNSTSSIDLLKEAEKKERNILVKTIIIGSLIYLTKEKSLLENLLKCLYANNPYVPIYVIENLITEVNEKIITINDILDILKHKIIRNKTVSDLIIELESDSKRNPILLLNDIKNKYIKISDEIFFNKLSKKQ